MRVTSTRNSRWAIWPGWVARVVVLAGLLGAMGSGAVHAKAPEIPEPPDSTVVPVGQNMRINGTATQAHSFRSGRSVEQVLAFYRRQWRRGVGDLPGYREAEEPPWQIISRIEDGYFLTVQVKSDGGGSSGYLSVAKFPTRSDQPELSDFPRLNGTRVLSDVETEDPGKKGRTLILLNDKSVASNVNYYREYFGNRGWQAQRDRDFAGKGHVFSFTKTEGLINIVISRNGPGGTSVVVNAVNSGF